MARVKMFGRFSILALDREVSLPTAKVRLLAAYLFWQQGRWVRRELLRGMLWGEMDEERAAGSLRTALHSLRRALESGGAPRDLLEIRRDTVRVTDAKECLVDARVFEEKAWSGLQKNPAEVEPLLAAASLYRGDFLEDLDADWCLSERRRLADLYIAVLRALVDRLASLGLQEAAVSYASRWLSIDPLDEAAHQALMRLYCAMGQPARVVEQYEQCRQALKVELGISPGESTVRLFRELGPAGPEEAGRRPDKNLRSGREWNDGKPGPPERLSEDPLRNARLLLVYGEDKALQGDLAEAMAALEKAVRLYEQFGDEADQAKARLILGKTLLALPPKPQGEKALAYIEPALAYYRTNGPPAVLCQALLLAANARWVCLQNKGAAALAQEGLAVACALNDKEAEARLALFLGLALRDGFRLGEARAAFERAVQAVPSLTDPCEMLWLVLQRGILAALTGELPAAESFLREALSLGRVIHSPSPRIKQGEFMARSLLMVVLHYRDKRREMEALLPPPGAEKYNPEPLTYLNSLYLPNKNPQDILMGLEGWLRARISDLNPPMVACTIRAVVEGMLAAGLTREAARWAAVGVRFTRFRGWPGGAALFYCHRAVALARLGHTGAAAVCRRRAAEAADQGDQWTPAWLARVDGLIAREQGDAAAAERHLAKSRRLFQRIGDRYDARQVEAEMKGQKNPRHPPHVLK